MSEWMKRMQCHECSEWKKDEHQPRNVMCIHCGNEDREASLHDVLVCPCGAVYRDEPEVVEQMKRDNDIVCEVCSEAGTLPT